MGDVTIREFKKAQFTDDLKQVGITNEDGEVLFVPKHILELYVSTNPLLLKDMAENIQDGRSFAIGSVQADEVDEELVDLNDKYIFCNEDGEVEEDVLFPELVHGDYVVLEGEVTRENKTSNSMGFKYNDHILTAYPDTGSIVRYKPLLFLRCRLFGTVNRIDETGRIGARRPKLYFSNLEPLEKDRDYSMVFE
jgi:hypothetical protein